MGGPNHLGLNKLIPRLPSESGHPVCGIKGMHRDIRGQAIVEYAIAVFITALGTVAIINLLLAALKTYYQEVTTLISLPIP